ncbi:hypothetical protein B1C81_29265, partial [Streptomyces sp. HG99]
MSDVTPQDFGDVYVKLAGVSTKCSLFTFRLSYSGKAAHRIFASEGQEAFFEGHVHAFRVLGGHVRDNSSAISCSRSGWSLRRGTLPGPGRHASSRVGPRPGRNRGHHAA